MKSKIQISVLFILPLLALLAAPSQAAPVCVTFEPPLLLGTTYGAPAAQVSGSLAFVSNGIRVYVYKFGLITSGTAFNKAYIDFAPVGFSPGQSIRTNNINLLFDFSALGFKPSKVTFSYLDLGGYENLAINGGSVYVGELTSAPPVMSGVSVAVSQTPVPPPMSGKMGVAVLKGTVKSLLIGGQELWIDNVCAE
jgi:hypothetical protein